MSLFRVRWFGTEFKLAVVGGLLNGVWEFLHSPLYTDHVKSWFYVLWTRVHCTIGDVMILLFTFWLTSLLFGNRRWIERLEIVPLSLFTLFGLSYTIYSEWYNVYVRQSWTYTDAMPEIAGIGLTPLFQWVILPPMISGIIWLTLSRDKEN